MPTHNNHQYTAHILATGSYLPRNQVSNQDLVSLLAEKNIETSHEWIYARTGISFRHYANDDETNTYMAYMAAQQALNMANMSAESIDLIIVATSTPDHLFPGVATSVQHKLGIKNCCPAFDVQAVCSGFIYAMSIATQFIENGSYENILVIGSEVFSRLLNFEDRTTCVLFGDGAGAAILSRASSNETQGIKSCVLHTDASGIDMLCAKAHVKNGSIVGEPFVYMEGQNVFKMAVTRLEEVALKALTQANLSTHDIDWLIPHQANIRIMQGTAKKLGLDLNKMIATVEYHGNTSAASIPLALDVAVRDGRIQKGQNVLMEAVGSGFGWGACVIEF
jgi:3-oxoacyl-[acyl-carrier-protein] synthase III